jgi:arginyl-tRNA synthetase
LIKDLKTEDLKKTFGENTLLSSGADGSQTVIIEFSSPNIAKPFHVGNYRSTIIGNFVANLHQFCGHNVIRLNYLGDFGTQFGILSLAFDYFGNDKSLAEDPLRHLFDVYVKGNTECKSSEEWRQSAKNRFNELESKQNSEVLKQWHRFRELSVTQLKALYERLGIAFDEFHSESMYSKASLKLIDELRHLGRIQTDETGAHFAVINGSNNESLRIPVIKSDGSTLYLTRY